ncbi:hypothetical protein ESCO_005041 [Escovopsis weberi]|uniref:Uncharacterized protein n=1 Tax=Escovopsis weberi TaxID=150374 RepID=A0A0M9VVY0_ESCWE|nr:hypothetical protein ESCO_005041 [Escovopsis weberi]
MDAIKSTRPFVYVILPLILILVIGSLALTYHMRRRRYRPDASGQWPGFPASDPDAPPVRDRGRRTGDWAAPPLEEGLNELGEAPPPYVKQKEAPTADVAETAQTRQTQVASRPPEYWNIPQPPPAVTRNAT